MDPDELGLDRRDDLRSGTNDEDVAPDSFSLEAPVQAHGAFEAQLSEEPAALPQEGADIAEVDRRGLAPLPAAPILRYGLYLLPSLSRAPVQDDRWTPGRGRGLDQRPPEA